MSTWANNHFRQLIMFTQAFFLTEKLLHHMVGYKRYEDNTKETSRMMYIRIRRYILQRRDSVCNVSYEIGLDRRR